MARTGLGWRADDLAAAADLTRVTVARFELGQTVTAASTDAIRSALQSAGVDFTAGNGRLGVSVPQQR
jgi:transcriptional regulator with XRE-family HTH domain